MYVTKIWSKYSKHCRQERIPFLHLWYVTTSCLLKLYLLSFSLPLRALRVLISKMSSGKRQFFCYIFPAFLAFLHGTMMNCQSLIDCKAWPWHFLLSWVCSSVLSRQAHAQWGRHYIFLAAGQRQACSRNQFLSVCTLSFLLYTDILIKLYIHPLGLSVMRHVLLGRGVPIVREIYIFSKNLSRQHRTKSLFSLVLKNASHRYPYKIQFILHLSH